MNLSKEAMLALQRAIEFANKNHYEYVTPEMILLMILDDPDFADAYEACGGDIHTLNKKLMEYVSKYLDKVEGKDPEFSLATQQMMTFAGQSAYSSGCNEIHVRHLIHSLWNLDNSYAVYYMEQDGIAEADLLQELSYIEDETRPDGGSASTGSPMKQEDTGNLKIFAPCLNDTLRDVNPLIGRKDELERTIQILCRKDKNNPLHIGEPGVGKTAITYGLVELLRKGKVPDAIKGAKVFALDLGGMLAGTQYRGDFEKRFKKVLTEIGKEDKPIIYIDEIHNLSGAGAVGEGSFDASNMLKPYLTDGHIRFIGATTYEEYKKYFEKNKSLVRRFQNVEIKEPTEEESIKILEGLREKYEKYHGVKYKDDVLPYVAGVWAAYRQACEADYSAKLYIEQRVSVERWAPDCWGTADAIVSGLGTLHVFDLKYGRGVRVNAYRNPQLLIYALGATELVPTAYIPREIDMTIWQVRLRHVTTYTVTSRALLEWGRNEFAPAAQRAHDCDGRMVAGPHCKFCKAAGK